MVIGGPIEAALIEPPSLHLTPAIRTFMQFNGKLP